MSDQAPVEWFRSVVKARGYWYTGAHFWIGGRRIGTGMGPYIGCTAPTITGATRYGCEGKSSEGWQ
jgi:hypothetical protein